MNSIYMQGNPQQKFYSWLNAQGAVTHPPQFTTLPSYPPVNPMPLAPEEQSFDWWGLVESPLDGLQPLALQPPVTSAASVPGLSINQLGLDLEAFIAEPVSLPSQ